MNIRFNENVWCGILHIKKNKILSVEAFYIISSKFNLYGKYYNMVNL